MGVQDITLKSHFKAIKNSFMPCLLRDVFFRLSYLTTFHVILYRHYFKHLMVNDPNIYENMTFTKY